jgi:hypothetical protein
MMRTALKSVAFAGIAVAQIACALLTDPAVRLARCTERASQRGTLSMSCDPKVPGGYLAILYPQGEVSDQDLTSAGVPPRLLGTLRRFRLGTNPAIYVFPDSSSQLPSRTTSQMHHVRFPKLIVVHVPPEGSLELVLERDAQGLSVIAAHPVSR